MPAVAGGADDGFLLYAPSGKQRGLLVVRALTETKGDKVSATLELVRTEPLGFPASHIAVHPTLPLVYVSGGPGKDGHNAAVVPLDKAGMPLEPKLVTLDNDGSGGPGAVPIDTRDERITAEALEPFLTDDVAVITLQAVQYRSGARSDIKAINDLARSRGVFVVWDCAHAIGSIELDFDDNGVDLAVGCTYKYGNSGPGAPAWLFVRRELQGALQPPIQGWFAQDDQFAMGPIFDPATTIRRFQIASPSIMGLRSVQIAFDMIGEAGISAIARKAELGTEMMIRLVDEWLVPLGFRLGTPREAPHRGGHITVHHPDAKQIANAMRKMSKVIPDFRMPDGIRMAMAPLPTSFVEVWDGLARTRDLVASGEYQHVTNEGNRVT
jgi:kynureninase